ncbi:MAG: hypothetical protein DRN99_05735 [Thermoproteota archaeon]|nr:MAG: hypothetical protein DRN99_05735 [Candidatus Korarchaeota archaeon]
MRSLTYLRHTHSEAVVGNLREREAKIYFPTSEVFKLVIAFIQKRFSRVLLTVSGVTLSIAFYTTLVLTATVSRVMGSEAGTLKEYYIWMLILSVLVAGAGIMNSIFMAVAERTREIGTMKCLGALYRHILEIFLIESALLGFIGGLLGYIMGIFATVALTAKTLGAMAIFKIPGGSMLAVFARAEAISVGLSVLAAAYPAYRAAKLDPAEALRFVI